MTAAPTSEALLLDEMFSTVLASSLRGEGFDVVAVAGHPVLAAGSDVQVARWAAQENRRVVTENVRDYVPLLTTEPELRVLFTSSRRFPRSRHNPGPSLQALREWLTAGPPRASVEWLP